MLIMSEAVEGQLVMDARLDPQDILLEVGRGRLRGTFKLRFANESAVQLQNEFRFQT